MNENIRPEDMERITTPKLAKDFIEEQIKKVENQFVENKIETQQIITQREINQQQNTQVQSFNKPNFDDELPF